MNKLILIVVTLSSILCVSCDEVYYDAFVLKNECDDTLKVSLVISRSTETTNLIIPENNDTLFHITHWVGHQSDIIEKIFTQIHITKNGIVSNKNYIDKTKWNYVDRDKTCKIWTLTVNPEDFE